MHKFEYYISKLYYDHTRGVIVGRESLNNAIRVLLAETLFGGSTIDLNLRVAWERTDKNSITIWQNQNRVV